MQQGLKTIHHRLVMKGNVKTTEFSGKVRVRDEREDLPRENKKTVVGLRNLAFSDVLEMVDS
jgi:hypothetical protein